MFRPVRRRAVAACFALALAGLLPSVSAQATTPAVPESSEVPAGAPSVRTSTVPVPQGAPAPGTRPGGAAVAATATPGLMLPGERLESWETLTSPRGTFQLRLENGTLVLTRGTTTTYRSAQVDLTRYTWGDRLVLQGDGNLVLYGYDGVARWNTRTWGNGPTKLRLQEDGNLVLYSATTGKPLWYSGIMQDATGLANGTTLPAGRSLYTPDGTRQLSMQGDGNLVYRQGTRVLWNSRTTVPGSRLVVSGGDARVVTPNNRTLWSTPTGTGATLRVQGDGNLVVYAPKAVWHTNTPLPNCSAVTGPVDPGQVVKAANGVLVHRCVAGAYNRMVADAAARGVDLRGGGYRDPAQQIAVRKANCGTTYYDIYEKPSGQCTPPTARPGNSMHERGLAVDFSAGGRSIGTSSAQFAWLSKNADLYGFYNLPSEPWHWSTNGY